MKQALKDLLYRIAPRWTTSLMSARARRHSQWMIASWGNGPLVDKLLKRFGSSVQDGPFAGLTLTASAQAEQIGPYLLGLYESELDKAWETIFSGTYTQVIDIGAKFGYYAVGLARKYPLASIVAFDTDWWARRAICETATANAVHNVDVKGFCSSEWLSKNLQEASLIISDCEGYEDALFGDRLSPELGTATLIIETHDREVPGVTDKLGATFKNTHVIQMYDEQSPRRVSTRPLGDLSAAELQLATQEVRPAQRWLLCLPKAGPNNALLLTVAAGGSTSDLHV